MNPLSQVAPGNNQSLVNGVVQSTAPPTSVQSQPPIANALNVEIVHGIAVKDPDDPKSKAKPQPQNTEFLAQTRSSEDKDLDKILHDVNSSVKQAGNSLETRFEHLGGVRKKAAIKKVQLDRAHNGTPPITATAIACLIALILSASALMVFKNG
ncbi:MAG TPA: hypothetical protein VLG25_01820 [Patescibacteria group bacterium]|nr:hypothetical protein [Patescibacteria group bacterium]